MEPKPLTITYVLYQGTHHLQEITVIVSSKITFCLKLAYVKESEATKSYINLHCGSHNLSYIINEHIWCMLPPDIGYSICTLDAYDIVGNSVKNKSDPAIHLVNITVFGGSTSNKLMVCCKNHFFLHSNSEFNQNKKTFDNSFYCRDIV